MKITINGYTIEQYGPVSYIIYRKYGSTLFYFNEAKQHAVFEDNIYCNKTTQSIIKRLYNKGLIKGI